MKTNTLVQGLVIAAAIIAISLALVFAERAHWVGEMMSLRISMAMSGFIVAYYGNAIPKAVFRNQRAANVQRFAGWVFVITGLTYAGAWLFAPMAIAYLAMFVIAGGMAMVLGYCFWSRTPRRPQVP